MKTTLLTTLLLALLAFLHLTDSESSYAVHPSVDAITVAHSDIQAWAESGPVYAPQIRYLQVPDEKLEDRLKTVAAVNYVLNAISRVRNIRRAEMVDPEWHVIRIHTAAYADARIKTVKSKTGVKLGSVDELLLAWEDLVKRDPYYHVRPGVMDNGTIKETLVDGQWVAGAPYDELKKLTKSRGPILNAHWFITQVLTAPTYYQWEGIPKTQKEFYTLIGRDDDELVFRSAKTGANLDRSKVTKKRRRIDHFMSFFGGTWTTYDVTFDSADKDPIRNPVDFQNQVFKYDANEVFRMKSNGFWECSLWSAETGERQDAVPQEIVPADPHSNNQTAIIPLVSCIRCHEKEGGTKENPAGGLQPFADVQSIIPVNEKNSNAETVQQYKDFYVPEGYQDRFVEDATRYAKAVFKATGGMTTYEITDVISDIFQKFVYDSLTLELVAAEMRIPIGEAAKRWELSEDPDLNLLLRGQSISRANWETAYPEASVRMLVDLPVAADIKNVNTEGKNVQN